MSYPELLLLAISLCFDTFAVSFSGGISLPGRAVKPGEKIRIYASFALFQTGFMAAGWALGMSVESYIRSFDHWLAAGLLGYIGGKMILESREEQKEQDEQRPGKAADLLNPRYLAMASVATSIDALAVGISLAAIQLGGIRLAAGLAMTAAVTALASYLGVNGGNRAGRYLGRRSEMAGGLILIGIGIKILIEHLTV